ncbi:Nitrous oxide reductase maturation periplasmic protein NosX [Castellaniella defragrans 65Phen]|uniref:FAD:protein FMN transferase n=1 Tax=Castellaniella defragrans (strain DSM 12143 / CCUG 39792 / 65Phen) TaxID=1437824 RepID=W8WZR7_CASD6|nr:FAD:protein FMN transferase [Castellaniella defragrans]CDM25104.1 Nitrous oxide reductase maturation periplasmic protein NosX [Castellaniella defragrans 65Phen]
MNTPLLPRRRRFLGILAASAALVGPGPLRAALRDPAALPEPVVWNGVALGADAQLQLLHPDRAHAERLVRMAVAEVHRLEQVFSLYREDSALARLNRAGRLDAPPPDLSRLLSQAVAFGERTGGLFDPSVQVLWDLYAARVLAGRPLPPDPAELRAALAKVDYRAIRLEEDAIVLERPGMALTLNGIAQGYITDRVTELLRANGLEHAMIDLGEARGLGAPAPDRPWRAGIADPREPSRVLETIDLGDRALATSGGYGTPLDPAGHFTHLFDPHTGQATPRWRSVTVRAADATTADALSTAFAQMPADTIRGMISRFPVQAWLMAPDAGTLIRLG